MGNGDIDFKRFARYALPLAARHVAHGAHVVAAIGQFDQNHPNVARHGQQHFAERFGLAFFAGVEFEFVEFGQTIDQIGHLDAKALDQIGFGDAAVFHRVVKQGGAQGLGVEFPLGALGGYGDGVGDVGFTVFAQLPQMGLVRVAVGFANLIQAFVAQIREFFGQRSKARRCGIGCGLRFCAACGGSGGK